MHFLILLFLAFFNVLHEASTLCHFMNSDLKKQAQALEVTFSGKTKSYHSQTCFNNILRIYLNEKLNFYHHIIERNAQMHVRSENLFY